MRKRLGQHFLKERNALRKIVEALNIKSGDIIVEIGPGHGELTEEFRIQNSEFRIIAIEKDKKLTEGLKKKFVSDKNIEIVEGDALKVLPQLPKSYILNSKFYKVVGNIPYYITGHLLRILGELKIKPKLIVLTIQKEVAERICAKPPKMNLLAASVQFWAEPEIIGLINRKSFSPPPEVDGAVVKLTPKRINKKLVKKYYELIKVVFKQPRKTALNNLAASLKLPKKEIIEKLTKQDIRHDLRPQDLTIENLTVLSNVFRAKK